MKNYEFYKEEIEMRYRECTPFALTKQNCIASCEIIDCEECVFSCDNNPETRGLNCGDRKIMWALQEHVENPKLTKQERKFCEMLEGKDCWFVRDSDETLCLFVDKPYKEDGEDMWWADKTGAAIMTGDDFIVFEIEMSFIKWEDKEPWSVEELLKLEVKE